MTAAQTKSPESVASFVLPKPPRERGDVVTREPLPASWRAGLHAGAEAVAAFSGRLQSLVECQERFLGEMRATLAEMDTSVHEETRARLKGQVRTLTEILDWSQAVHADLAAECRRAHAGHQVVDVASICRLVAAEFPVGHDGTAVAVLGAASKSWCGCVARLADLLEAAVSLVHCRVGGRAGITIEIGENGGWLNIRVVSPGEPGEIDEPELVTRFRLLAREVSATVLSDEFGSGGTSLVVRIPNPVEPN